MTTTFTRSRDKGHGTTPERAWSPIDRQAPRPQGRQSDRVNQDRSLIAGSVRIDDGAERSSLAGSS